MTTNLTAKTMTGCARGLTRGIGALLVLVAATTATAGSMSHGAAKKDIVDTAVAAGGFETLVTAVKAAGLVETLKGPGPFTVFAPTDEAFSRVPPSLLNALLNDKQALIEVLTYHVVPGKVMAADVVKLTEARTVQGESVAIVTRSGVMVDGASVVATDIETSNGVIHVIDKVILPRSVASTLGSAASGAAQSFAGWKPDERGSFGR